MASQTKSKPNANFFREVKAELSKVTWPTRQQTVRYTIIVIIAAVVSGLVVGGVDFVLSEVLTAII